MIERVAVSDIRWLKAARDDVIVHTTYGSVRAGIALAKLAAKLDPQIMIQVSRSAIVHRQAVTAVQMAPRGGLRLRIGDDAFVRVGETFLGLVRRMLELPLRATRTSEP